MLALIDWLRAHSPELLEDAVIQWASVRKRRLIMVGICHRVAHLLSDERLIWLGRQVIEEPLSDHDLRSIFPSILDTLDVVERYADGLVSDEVLNRTNLKWEWPKSAAWSLSNRMESAEPELIRLIVKASDEVTHFNTSARELNYVWGCSALAIEVPQVWWTRS